MPDLMPILLLVMLAAYGFGALAALISTRAAACRALAAVGAVVGAGAGIGIGALVLIERTPFTGTLLDLLPLTGFALRIDGLGAFFLVIIGLVGGAAAIYGFGYS